MKIAVICSPLIQCPPIKYGGIERMVYWVARGMVRQGEEVTLFGRTGSHLDGAEVVTYLGGEDVEFANLIAETAAEYDVIHDVTHDKFLTRCFPEYKNKIINTLQGLAAHGPNTICISQAQRRDLGYGNHIPVIYNGVPIDEYLPISNPTCDYLLYCGSINDYKGVDIAIELCKKTNQKLKIAGVPWDQAYHQKFVWPQCDGENIIWCDEVGGEEKLSLIQNAKALIHPVRWTEPGAIIVSEALACGVPVIGSDNGVMPEFINPAVGKIFHVQHFDSYPHMAGGCYDIEGGIRAIETIDEINRDDCVEYARARLSDTRMTQDYFIQYQRIIDGDNWE